MRRQLGYFFSLFIIPLVSLFAQAGALSDLEVYERCYKKMVRDVPSTTDTLWKKVAAKELSGPAACLSLFDKASWTSNGQVANPADPVARNVVRTFHDFHRSWFQSLASQLGNRQGFSAFSLIADSEEPALYLSRALFAGKQYKSVVTDKLNLQGLRYRETGKDNLRPFAAQSFLRYPTNIPGFTPPGDLLRIAYRPVGQQTDASLDVDDTLLVQVGDLIGVRSVPTFVVPHIRTISRHDLSNAAFKAATENVPVNESLGGGILGSPAYIMSNASLELNRPAESDASSTYLINRVTAARVFEDLLCHQLPTLEASDVTAFVKSGSQHAFQRSESCQQCHAQVDAFAHVYRNLVLGISAGTLTATQTVGFPIQTYARIPASASATAFAEQPPAGVLRYRSFRAKKPTTLNFTGLAEAGAGLANSTDLYECAAKRYYQFFTGIEVPLSTLTPPGNADSETVKAKYALDKKHQNFVLALATNLKKNQSLRSMVQSILSSTQFKTRDFQSVQEVE